MRASTVMRAYRQARALSNRDVYDRRAWRITVACLRRLERICQEHDVDHSAVRRPTEDWRCFHHLCPVEGGRHLRVPGIVTLEWWEDTKGGRRSHHWANLCSWECADGYRSAMGNKTP